MLGLKPGRAVDLGELWIDVNEDSLRSDAMDFSGWRGSFSSIAIEAPGTLTGVIRVQVSESMEDVDEFGTTWRDKQSGGLNIEIAATGHVTIQAVDFKRLRLRSNAAEAVDRRFRIKGYEAAQ